MMRQHTQPDSEMHTNQAVDLDAVLRHYIADPTASWGLGTFGAVAEFHRTGDEPVRLDTGATLKVVTARGALRIGSTEETRACASATRSCERELEPRAGRYVCPSRAAPCTAAQS